MIISLVIDGTPNAFSKLTIFQVLPIDKFHGIISFNTYPSLDHSILIIDVDAKKRVD